MNPIAKKTVSITLALLMLLSLVPFAFAANEEAPTTQNLTVDGEAVTGVEIYNIDGNSYIRLRDLALILNDTDASFSVAYDEATGIISLVTGEKYEAIGGELAVGDDKSASCVTSTQPVTVNGRELDLAHFNLGGTNFFRLRDLGASLGFDVDYDEASATMIVSTEQGANELRLGVSNYYMQVPANYVRGLMTPEDVEDNMVGYYKSAESLMDFDVYQFSKADEPAELEAYAAKEAADYNSEPVSTTVNGVACCYYDAVEESDGETYNTRTYIFDTGTGYVELVFWLDGETASEEMESIVGTVQFMRSLRLGVSDFYVNVPNSYTRGTVTSEEVAAGMVGYYTSEETELDFDVFQFKKADEPAVLREYAAKRAAEYGSVPTMGQLNGIPVAFYDAMEDYGDESYNTRTYILDTGTGYVVVRFWLDGEKAETETQRIMNSLSGKVSVALGDSPYSVTVPYGYYKGEVTEEDKAEGIVLYYLSDISLLDFDIFKVAKEDETQTIAAFAEAEAAEYGVAVTNARINGIPTSYYRAFEEYDGVTYKILVFVLDSRDSFVKLRFWLDGDTAADAAMGIIKTLDRSLVVDLASSGLTVTVPSSYYAGEVTEEDAAEGIVAYYKSDATLLDFDVFEFSKEGKPDTLSAFAEAEAAKHGVGITPTAIKGVSVCYYRALATYDDVTYRILVFVLDGGDNYVALRFWLDGDTAADEAMAIIRTIK